MKIDSKKRFYCSEKLIISITHPIGNIAYRIKKRKHPESFFLVRDLCVAAKLDVDNLSEEVQKILDTTVSQVCRAGSRFTKNCICVQLYEDSKEIMQWAMEHGALLCIARYPIEGYPCIVVNDPERVYADMCGKINGLSDVMTTVITGSIGKTTTKKMIASVYKQQYTVFCDAGNDNQLDGVGYISQHIPSKTQMWIQEISEDTKGMVTEMSKIVRPKVAIITAIDKSHIEEFGDEDGIIEEIKSICDYMPDDGVYITSIDDDNTVNLIKGKKMISVSLHSDNADYFAKDIQLSTDGLKFNIIEKENFKSYSIELRNVYAIHNIYSALFAFAAGVHMGMDYPNIISGISKYKATGIRQNVYKSRGKIVYADCYNAVAKSVKSAINAASVIPVSGKRVAVLGDIAETGDFNEETHNEIVDIINSSNFDVFFAFGHNICSAVSRASMKENIEVVMCENRAQLNKQLKKCLKHGDLVLFKASHSMRLEKTIKKLFPLKYICKTIEYYWPQITWRFKVLFN